MGETLTVYPCVYEFQDVGISRQYQERTNGNGYRIIKFKKGHEQRDLRVGDFIVSIAGQRFGQTHKEAAKLLWNKNKTDDYLRFVIKRGITEISKRCHFCDSDWASPELKGS